MGIVRQQWYREVSDGYREVAMGIMRYDLVSKVAQRYQQISDIKLMKPTWSEWVRLGQARLGQVRLGQVGEVKLTYYDEVRLSQVELTWVSQVPVDRTD